MSYRMMALATAQCIVWSQFAGSQTPIVPRREIIQAHAMTEGTVPVPAANVVVTMAADLVNFEGDPFIGDWKLDASRTTFADRMKVTSAGPNKYRFDFGGGAETVSVDGTEQPGNSRTTLTIRSDGPHTWRVVRRANGRTLIAATWILSNDGKTLTDETMQVGADGSPINITYVYQKSGAGAGFAGEWTSISGTLKSVYLLHVRPWERDGLSLIDSLAGETKNLRFDGKDYVRQGQNTDARATRAARRVNERTLEIIDKLNGTITETRQITLSPDLKSLTISIRVAGSTGPMIRVFERQ